MASSPRLNDDSLQQIEQILGHSFADRDLLMTALTHRSFANEWGDEPPADNERLEFLGDAVLDLVVSESLMTTMPTADEGTLTRLRAEVVALPSLAGLARRLDLGRFLMLGRGEQRSGGRNKASLLADTMEALIGAVFCDDGYQAARAVALPLFTPLLRQAAAREDQDFKSRLQEYLQAERHTLPTYHLVDTSGPAHQRHYSVDVLVNGEVLGSGSGSSKKAAEQNAAQAALQVLEQ
jgi:ribonuclease III